MYIFIPFVKFDKIFSDEMCSTLMQERQRSTDLQQEIVKLTQACSSMREIQEQLNDAQVTSCSSCFL